MTWNLLIFIFIINNKDVSYIILTFFVIFLLGYFLCVVLNDKILINNFLSYQSALLWWRTVSV